MLVLDMRRPLTNCPPSCSSCSQYSMVYNVLLHRMMPPFRPVRTRQSGDPSSRAATGTKGASPSRAPTGRGGRFHESINDRTDDPRRGQLPTGNGNVHGDRHGCVGASSYTAKDHGRHAHHADRREAGPSSAGSTASATLRSFKSAMFYEYLEPEDEMHYHGNYHYSPKQVRPQFRRRPQDGPSLYTPHMPSCTLHCHVLGCSGRERA